MIPVDMEDEEGVESMEIEVAEEEEAQERGSWEGSDVTAEEIEWLQKSGRIPPGVQARLPLGEIEPCPQEGEHVVFSAHFERGFGLPVSDFFKSFLHTFQLQPHHLPPNAITLLSAYATFCESYVGIWPFMKFWMKYFSLRAGVVPDPENTDTPKQMVQCGAAIVVNRPRSQFPRVKGLESCKKWLRSFFYVKNLTDENLIRLPKFDNHPPYAKHNWGYTPKTSIPEVNYLHKLVIQYKKDGLTGDDLMRTFIGRRINPLQDRPHKMCFYSGRLDPSRMTTIELTKAQVRLRVKAIAESSMTDDWEWGIPPYDRENPPPIVSYSTISDMHVSDKIPKRIINFMHFAARYWPPTR